MLDADQALGEFRDLLDSAAIQVQEASIGVRDYLEGLELNPAQLNQVEERLGEIHDLARKYRIRPEELPDLTEQIRHELEHLEQADVQLDRLTAEVNSLRSEYLAAAGELGESRARKAEQLERDVSEAMQTLGMPNGQFSAELSQLSEEQAGSGGLEEFEFLVTANPGQSGVRW